MPKGSTKYFFLSKKTTDNLYDVSRLVLSLIVTWSAAAAQQQHRVCLAVDVTPNSCWHWIGQWQIWQKHQFSESRTIMSMDRDLMGLI